MIDRLDHNNPIIYGSENEPEVGVISDHLFEDANGVDFNVLITYLLNGEDCLEYNYRIVGDNLNPDIPEHYLIEDVQNAIRSHSRKNVNFDKNKKTWIV